MKMRPMIGKILVKLDEKLENRSAGGIILPGTSEDSSPRKAIVERLSKGRRGYKGDIIPFEVKEGDRIMITLYGGIQYDEADESRLLIEEEDILMILEE